jgi:hypothetical protein
MKKWQIVVLILGAIFIVLTLSTVTVRCPLDEYAGAQLVEYSERGLPSGLYVWNGGWDKFDTSKFLVLDVDVTGRRVIVRCYRAFYTMPWMKHPTENVGYIGSGRLGPGKWTVVTPNGGGYRLIADITVKSE